MEKPLVIVKLGGSAVTDKDLEFKPRLDVIRSVVNDLKELSVAYRFIVVHGGGSYGHTVAAKYGIHEGLKNAGQLIGYSKVRLAMMKLNMLIVEEFVRQGVPVAPMHTSSLLYSEGDLIKELFLAPVKMSLELGFTPVLYGDAVFDTRKGFAIVSGDQIIYRLAIGIKAAKVIFGTDVPGVFDKNPKIHSDARIIRRIKIRERIAIKDEGRSSHDVTGGMLAKLKYCVKIAEHGIPVIIGDITRKNGLKSLVLGTADYYTVIC